MSLKSKIQALITAANAKTGETDATLTDAVQTLVDGYGQGGTPVINPLTVTENGTYTAPEGVDGYSPVTVNVSGGGGLPEGIAELYTGTFTPTEDMTTYTVTHNLGKYPKVFLCFLDVPRIRRPGEKVMSFYIYFVGQNTETSGYLTQYTGVSTGNLSSTYGAAGIPAGTTINEIPMTALRGRFVSTLADVDDIIVPAVYRWVFLV